MRGDEILLLGIGIQPPWQLVDQHLDTSTQPHELHLEVAGERGARSRVRSAARCVRRTTSARSAGAISTFSSITATSLRRCRG